MKQRIFRSIENISFRLIYYIIIDLIRSIDEAKFLVILNFLKKLLRKVGVIARLCTHTLY